MQSKINKSCNENYFTVLYFQVLDDLQINFIEYLVLNTMLFKSHHNIYKNGISFLSTHLYLARGTIYTCIEILVKKEHLNVNPEKRTEYFINYDIRERMLINDGKFIRIYHRKRKELKLSVNQFAFIYLLYSLSKDKINRVSIAGIDFYINTLKFDKNYYYHSLKCFENKNLIEKRNLNQIKLKSELFNWFENTLNVQK